MSAAPTCWGRTMFSKPKRPISRVFIHCTASDNPAHDNVETITAWHKARGFSTIGYHFLIHKDGRVSPGRSLELTPAAQSGHNTGTIAISLHGLDRAKFTGAQFSALRDLCVEIYDAYNGEVTYHGHCEVANKACPVFDYRSVLSLSPKGVMGVAALPSTSAEDSDIGPHDFPTLRRGAKGADVRMLQGLLNVFRAPPPLAEDGDFGAKTEAAVQDFQRTHSLIPDGIVGPLTWEALDEDTDI